MPTRSVLLGAACAATLAGTAHAGLSTGNDPRLVQIRSVDTASGILELFNHSETDAIALDGWRFCSHDEDQIRRYSAANGLNTIDLAPRASLFIHFNNDAPAGEADRINLTGLGNFALPLDNGPYAIQIYFPPTQFGNGQQIADHLQWAVDGIDNASADERSDEAQNGGVWTDQTTWISTTNDTAFIRLNDVGGNELHGPADYDVLDAFPDCNENGIDDFADINFFDAPDIDPADGIPDACQTAATCPGDVNGDGQTTTADITLSVSNLGAGTPDAQGTPGDANGDGETTTADITFIVSNLGCDVNDL
ncbi:MAG: dockerin type I domain-containing protein [Planctomycetota bacterium]